MVDTPQQLGLIHHSLLRKTSKGATIHKTFFDLNQIQFVPDTTNIICSRHTIEHVADVHGFINSLTSPITTTKKKLFYRNARRKLDFENTAFQDFFYEHCSLYSQNLYQKVLGKYGLSADTTPVYGGQYMWTEAVFAGGSPILKDTHLSQKASQDLAKAYVQDSAKMLTEWRSFIREQSRVLFNMGWRL